MLEKIILIEPRGFCEGVRVAIETVERLAQAHPNETIYVRHEIVHNKHVTNYLKERYGVIFIEDLNEIPDNSRVVFSAHGTAPEVYEESKRKNLKVTDATCLLVEKVHKKAKRYTEKGNKIILIGHSGHQEVIGTMGQAKMDLVEKIEDIERIDIPKDSQVSYITQTTLSRYDTLEIEQALKRRFLNLQTSKDDICYATTNRQEAVMAIAPNLNILLVIGEENSSNSKRLVEVAQKRGLESYLISTHHDILEEWLLNKKILGLTAGASAPEHLVQECIAYLQKTYGGTLEVYSHKTENARFPSKDIT